LDLYKKNTMLITDARITGFNKYLAVTNGREKIYRAVQYFARFYGYYLLRHGAPSEAIQRWANLQNYLGLARKVFRFFKPVEVAQGIVKSFSIQDPVLRLIQLARLSSYLAYFTSETLSLV
jgi:peroxin-11B